MRSYNMTEDRLVEFKPRRRNAVFGVRNGSYVAYVWYAGEPYGDWKRRYSVGLEQRDRALGSGYFTNDFEDAKEHARGMVKGRAFRSFLRRMGGER